MFMLQALTTIWVLYTSRWGETAEVKDHLKRGLEIRLEKLGPEHVDVASPNNNLGSLHSILGETDEAKEFYKRALEIGMKKLRLIRMMMLQALTTIWVLCIVCWAKQLKQKTAISVH